MGDLSAGTTRPIESRQADKLYGTNHRSLTAVIPTKQLLSLSFLVALPSFPQQLTGRLHGTIVGPTGQFDRSVRPVGPTIVSCKRFVRPVGQTVGRIKHV